MFLKALAIRHDDRARHIRARMCNPEDYVRPPGLSQEEMGGLRACGKASGRGSKYERRWYALWEFLSGRDSKPPTTPYAGSEFQERMELAAADVANDHGIHEFANGFPADQRAEIHRSPTL